MLGATVQGWEGRGRGAMRTQVIGAARYVGQGANFAYPPDVIHAPYPETLRAVWAWPGH